MGLSLMIGSLMEILCLKLNSKLNFSLRRKSMKFKKFLIACFMCSLLSGGALIAADNTESNVSNYSPAVNTELWILPLITGATHTSSSAELLGGIVVPSKYKILSVKARAEYFDNGTASNRYFVDIEEALTGTTTDTTILSGDITIGTASSSVTGSISDSTVADESLLNIYGYGSSTRNLLLQIYVERSN